MSSNWNVLLIENEQHSINVYEPEVPRLYTMGNSHTNLKKLTSTKFVTPLLWKTVLIVIYSIDFQGPGGSMSQVYGLSSNSYKPVTNRRGFVPGFVNYKKECTRLAAVSDKVYQLLVHGAVVLSRYSDMFDINVSPPSSYFFLNLCCRSDPKQSLLLIIVSILVDFGKTRIPNPVCKITQ